MSEMMRKGEEEAGRSEAMRSLAEAPSRRSARPRAPAAQGRRLRRAIARAPAASGAPSEKNAVDESVMRLQTQLREDAARSLCGASRRRRPHELTRDRDAVAEEKSRVAERLPSRASKAQAEARSAQLEKLLALAQEEHGATQVRLDGAEGRLRDMGLESILQERVKLEQESAVATSERRRIESLSRAEAQVKEMAKDKQSLAGRADAAEARVKDVLGMRDAVIEERGRSQEALAAAQGEKAGLEELVRRCELQIRTLTDDKAAMLARADAAEERCKELTRQRDAAHAERSKLTEQLGVSHTERRAVEEVSADEWYGEERPPIQRPVGEALRRDGAQRDALAREAGAREQLTESKDARPRSARRRRARATRSRSCSTGRRRAGRRARVAARGRRRRGGARGEVSAARRRDRRAGQGGGGALGGGGRPAPPRRRSARTRRR